MKLFLRSILFFAVASFSVQAFGDTVTIWNNTGGTTDFATASNWSNGVPNATNAYRAVIMPGFTSSTASPEIVITGGPTSITITNTASNQFAQGLSFFGNFDNLGSAYSGTATLTFSGSGSTLTVADNIEINGGDVLVFSGNLLAQSGNIFVGDGTSTTGGVLNPSIPGSGTLDLLSGTLNFDPSTGNTTTMTVGSGTGNAGDVTQGYVSGKTSSVVTTGNLLAIGYNGGTGNYYLTNGSTLQTGIQPTVNYVIAIGANGGASGLSGTGSNGTLTISDTSLFILGSSTTGADLQLGTVASGAANGTTGGSGNIVQNGASTVSFEGTSTVEVGDLKGGTGTYTLNGGNLNIGTSATDSVAFTLGATTGSSGTLTQSGGTLTASTGSTVTIGVKGTGQYEFSGGNAVFENGFTVGANGTVTQSSGSTLAALNTVTFAAGSNYTMNGGTADFSNPSATVPYSSTLALNGTLNLNGGTLQVGEDMLKNSNTTGSLNFGGGTLKLTSGATTTFTDTFAGGVLAANSVSTIDASTSGLNTFNFANALLIDSGNVGGGGIILIGDGTTAFNYSNTAVNTYTGPTTIEEGTLNTSAANIASSSSLTMGTGGTLNLTLAAGGLTYGGSIAGPGTLDVNYSNAGDLLTIKGTSSFTGNIVLGNNGTAGILQVYNGTFGSISDNGTGSDLIVGDNSGTATGTVTLLGDTYTGGTTVNNGFTLNTPNLDGDLSNAGVVNVSGAAGVAGNVTSNSGTLSAQNVDGNILSNTGTLASNATLGSVKNTPTFTIGGTLTSSGTIQIRLNGTNADYYNVTGTANVSGTDFKLINGSGTGTYTILNSTGLTANNLTTNAPGTLFSATLTTNATQVILHTVQNPLGGFAQTPNQAAVAGALDPLTQTPSATFAPLLATLNNLSASEIPVALDQLSPSSLQYARNISFENSTFMAQQIDGELANIRSGFQGIDASGLRVVDSGLNNNLGMSLGSMLAYNAPSFNQPAPNGVNYYPQDDMSPSNGSSTTTTTTTSTSVSSPRSISDSPNPETITSPTSLSQSEPDFKGPKLNEFILGNVVLADLNQDQGAPNAAPTKASYTAGNVAAGLSFRMTSNLSAGVLFDYNHTDAKTDSYGSKTKVDSYSPGIFGTYSSHGFFVNGLFSFGYNSYSNTRNIPTIGSSATSSPDGQQYVANLDGGYDFQPRNHREWIFGPNLGLTYTHLDIDSFTESGAGPADLSVHDQSVDSLRSRLGGHVVYQARSGSILFQPNFTAMWQHEFLNDGSGITSQFNIPGSNPFTIQTANSGKDTALLGVGLTATLDNSMAFYLNYLADVGASDYFAQSIEGGFKASF